MPEDRKCLGVLQPRHQNQTRLSVTPTGSLQLHTTSRGKKRKSDENFSVSKAKRKDGIFEDSCVKKQTSHISVETQTDPTITTPSTSQLNSALDMLISDTAPSEYWQGLAEKRQEALEQSLEENQQLHRENQDLREEVTRLKEDNHLMEDMVEEAKQLALLLQPIAEEEEVTGEHFQPIAEEEEGTGEHFQPIAEEEEGTGEQEGDKLKCSQPETTQVKEAEEQQDYNTVT